MYQPYPSGGKPMDQSAQNPSGPMPTPATPKQSNTGMAAGAAGNKPGMPAARTLPLDDDVVKEVWGHLPDKLRQQVTQYYKEQFMPKYSDLLKQYYSSLANTPMKPGELRR